MPWILVLQIPYVLVSEWWSGILQHSVLSPTWWGSVLQGSVGSFVALMGVFVVIRHERRRDERTRQEDREKEKRAHREEKNKEERARQAEKAKHLEQRSIESVASMQTVALDLMQRDAKGEEDPEGAFLLIKEILIFSIREGADYPELDRWLTRHHERLIPWLNEEGSLRIAAAVAALITGGLLGWVQRGRLMDDEVLSAEYADHQWDDLHSDLKAEGLAHLLR